MPNDGVSTDRVGLEHGDEPREHDRIARYRFRLVCSNHQDVLVRLAIPKSSSGEAGLC